MTHGWKKPPPFAALRPGLTREEMRRPIVGVCNSANEIVPGTST
jgi:dihydroxy-acid dehydratase